MKDEELIVQMGDCCWCICYPAGIAPNNLRKLDTETDDASKAGYCTNRIRNDDGSCLHYQDHLVASIDK